MLKNTRKKLDKSTLISLGMKEMLVNKLSNNQVEGLLSFAMDHSKANNLLQMLIQLASMDIGAKSGAIKLAAEGIASPLQLKNLSAEQVKTIFDDYAFHEDAKIAIKNVKRMVVLNQQEKMYMLSGGIKGEYYIDPKSTEEEEDFV